MAGIVEVLAHLTGDAGGMVAAFKTAEDASKKFEQSMASASSTTQSHGSKIASTLSDVGKWAALGLGAVGLVSIKMAADFEKSTNLLMTAGSETQKTIGGVRQKLLDMSVATGANANQLADGLYILEKAGYDAAHGGLDILANSAKAAAAENVDLATMTSAVSDIMLNYGGTAKNSAMFVNEIVRASGLAKTTMEEFASSLHSSVPIAAAAGISFSEVAGAIATMTQHGTTAQQASQNLGHVMQSLQNPTQIMSAEWGKFGLSAVDLTSKLGERGLSGTLLKINDAVMSKMGPDGLVLQSAFNDSKAAGDTMNTMLEHMNPNLLNLSLALEKGEITRQQYTKQIHEMDSASQQQGMQFANLQKKTEGFNSLLAHNQSLQQTWTAEMSKMTGGMVGAAVATQLLAEHNLPIYLRNIKEIDDASKDASGDILGWSSTQNTLTTRLNETKAAVQAMLINIGTDLMPIVKDAASGIVQLYNGFKEGNPVLHATADIIGAVLVVAITTYIANVTRAAIVTAAQTAAMAADWLIMKGEIVVAMAQTAAQAIVSGEALAAFGTFMTGPIGIALTLAAALAGLIAAMANITTETGAEHTLDSMGRAIRSLSNGGDIHALNEQFSAWKVTLGGHAPIDAAGQAVHGLDDAVRTLASENGLDKFYESFDGFAKAAGGWGESSIGRVKDQFEQMDKSLAQMAASDSLKQAGAGFLQLATSYEAVGKSSMDALNAMPLYKAQLEDMAQKSGAATLSQKDLVTFAMGKIPQAMLDAADAQKNQAKAAQDQKQANDDAAKTLEQLGIDAAGAIVDVDGLAQSLMGLANEGLSAEQAHTSFAAELQKVQKRLDETREGVKGTARSMDVMTEAGNANRAMFDSLASSGLKTVEADAKNHASQEVLQSDLSQTYNSLEHAAEGFGLSKDAADELIKQILHIPPNVTIDTWMSDYAREKADETTRKVQSMPTSANVNVTTTGADSAIATLEQVRAEAVAASSPVQIGVNGVRYQAAGGYMQAYANGGWAHFDGGGFSGSVVGPGTATSDSIAAMLSNGEYVINANSVGHYGKGLMDAINNRTLQFGSSSGSSGFGSVTIIAEFPGLGGAVQGIVKSITDEQGRQLVSSVNRALRGAPGVRPGGF